MKDFCVVGSGIAGSTIANLLAKKYSVEIFEKARGPGGRASNRRYKKNLSFDHGLQYFSPKNIQFKKFILNLKKKNILKEWVGQHLDFNFKKKDNSVKYIGRKGNNDICKYLIKGIKVNYNSAVTDIRFKSNHWIVTLNNKDQVLFKYLILTCPFPQVKKLARNFIGEKILKLKVQMSPNITVMVAYKNSKKLAINSIKFNDEIISWASQENSKDRFKTNKILWTIQCTEEYSKKNINFLKKRRIKLQKVIIKKFEELIGFQIRNVLFKNIHGWKYAYCRKATTVGYSWSNKNRLAICGDWFNGSKAEDAWSSANELYNRIKKNPPKIN